MEMLTGLSCVLQAAASANKEAALKAAIAKRDAQIAELKSENESLKAPKEAEGMFAANICPPRFL